MVVEWRDPSAQTQGIIIMCARDDSRVHYSLAGIYIDYPYQDISDSRTIYMYDRSQK